jgi:citrate lyase beta subunit
VLWDARQAPDAVVLPKVRDADEVGLAVDLLEQAEGRRGLPPGSIRVALLIESADAVLRLTDLAERAGLRLCGLIFGHADFAADLRLPDVDLAHPAASWARTQVVAVAASRDVPAIDAMTFAFPVADPGGTAASNRAAFLGALAAVYSDARNAGAAGMSGKLVGHPAQLFATLLAFEAAVPDDALRTAASSVERYAAASDTGQGAVMIDGRMADVATDRHARGLLRRATANGRFDADRALALGIIDAAERAALSAEEGSEP